MVLGATKEDPPNDARAMRGIHDACLGVPTQKPLGGGELVQEHRGSGRPMVLPPAGDLFDLAKRALREDELHSRWRSSAIATEKSVVSPASASISDASSSACSAARSLSSRSSISATTSPSIGCRYTTWPSGKVVGSSNMSRPSLTSAFTGCIEH